MTCQECIEVLHLYLDRELTEAEVRQVERHLGDCPDCLTFFDFKKDVRKLVRRSIVAEAVEVPATLRASIESLRRRPGA